MKNNNYRLRFGLNLCIIILAAAVALLIRTGPGNGRKQSLDIILRRNLASGADIIYSAQPQYSRFSLGEEELYVLRLESGAFGVMRTMNTQVGNTSIGAPHDKIQMVPLTDGMAIIPLWVDSMAPKGQPIYAYCAVAMQSPDITRAQLYYYDGGGTDSAAAMMEHCDTINGLPIFRIFLGNAAEYSTATFSWESRFDIYSSINDYSFSAKGYNATGELVARIDRPQGWRTE